MCPNNNDDDDDDDNNNNNNIVAPRKWVVGAPAFYESCAILLQIQRALVRAIIVSAGDTNSGK